MEVTTDAVSDEFADHRISVADCLFFDVGANVAEAAAGMDALDGVVQDLFGDGEEAFGFGFDDADWDAHGGIADPSVANDADIQFDHVTVADLARSSDAVDDFFIDGNANVSRGIFYSRGRRFGRLLPA